MNQHNVFDWKHFPWTTLTTCGKKKTFVLKGLCPASCFSPCNPIIKHLIQILSYGASETPVGHQRSKSGVWHLWVWGQTKWFQLIRFLEIHSRHQSSMLLILCHLSLFLRKALTCWRLPTQHVCDFFFIFYFLLNRKNGMEFCASQCVRVCFSTVKFSSESNRM